LQFWGEATPERKNFSIQLTYGIPLLQTRIYMIIPGLVKIDEEEVTKVVVVYRTNNVCF